MATGSLFSRELRNDLVGHASRPHLPFLMRMRCPSSKNLALSGHNFFLGSYLSILLGRVCPVARLHLSVPRSMRPTQIR